jgi:fibronectin-binding autotransporter adhesin
MPAISSGTRLRAFRLASASLVVGFAAVSSVVLSAREAGAATQTVSNCNDSGAGSLRQAVASAGSGDTVMFALAPTCATITLASPIDIDTNLTIEGPGSSILAVSEGNSADVFDVTSGVTDASISGLTIENGTIGIDNSGTVSVTDSTLSDNGSNAGGAIVNAGTLTVTGTTLSENEIGVGDGLDGGAIDNQKGTVTITDSTLLKNAAANGANGGGIYNDGGSMTIAGSLLSGNNTGSGSGGGIYNNGGTLTVTASTLSGNIAVDGAGGGIDNHKGMLTVADSTLAHNKTYYTNSDGGGIDNQGALTVTNSTLSDNGAMNGGAGGDIFNGGGANLAATVVAGGTAGGDCSGSLADLGYNLDDDGTCGFTASTDLPDTPSGLDPAGLADNGGPTQTIALEPSSPAVAAVNDASLCSTPDQRGVARPTPCDIGAVQLALPAQAITSSDSATATVGSPFSFPVTTTGNPAPTIAKVGKLPKRLKLAKTGSGTAVITGTPTTAGVYHFTIKATFGKGKTRKVVNQPFVLTVDSASS